MLHKPDHGNTRSEGGGAQSDSETDNGDRLGARSDPPDRPSVRQLLIMGGGHDQNRGRDNQSTRARFLLTFPFAPLASTLAKYSSEPLGSAFIVLEPSLQFAGQTSPCSSWQFIIRR